MEISKSLKIPLQGSADQINRLLALQTLFSEACNAISPVAQENRCWNRVALHHLVYHKMRQQFEELGSQMICNAVYSVCRIYRLVYESPASPFSLTIREGKPLPLIKFLSNAPVYFDRHTLSIKGNVLSLYSLNGRVRFQLNLNQEALEQFEKQKLREIILTQDELQFNLSFAFSESSGKVIDLQWPNYVVAMQDGTEAYPLNSSLVGVLNERRAS
jgi:hypothetical protein